MTGLLRRWSFWCLASLVALSLFGGALFPAPPETEVAAPFSKPLWLDRSLAPTTVTALTPDHPAAAIPWDWPPPSRFALRLDVDRDAPELAVTWKKPGSGDPLQLTTLRRGAELDGRDMAFKRALGLSPFKDGAAELLSDRGLYELAVTGPGPWQGTVTLRLDGGRWGALGTDHRGRDIAALFVAGIRVSLLVGVMATLIATVLGTSVGLAAGYMGGPFDSLVMRLVDLLLSIPTLPILMALSALWGRGLWQIIVILSIFSWMGTARTVRALALTLRDTAYVEGLRGIGAPTGYILRRHLLPETLPVLLATMTLGVPGTILSEASLSFLGLSDPRVVSWGRMLHEAQSFGAFTAGAWWMLLPPGLGIAALCLAFLDLGKHLEERADPRLRGGSAP